ncbi:Pycsar system effector family protein [Glycomyces sp. YM15]|uniref:Pycsar system effector family protein n=1 Tax=Glycomyces sp. YM15 TaxID=2800446 RepID=UPI00196521F8|nr:Pycsar system effector family protein [Glycomyces sp. YM15]
MHVTLFSRTTSAPAPSAAPTQSPLVAFLGQRLDKARAQTDRADVKAQVLGAALLAGAAVAVGLGSVLKPPASVTGLAWAAAGLAVVVLGFLGCTVWPRPGSPETELEGLPLPALAALVADDDAYAAALHRELTAVRKIARRKFRWLRFAMAGFGAVVILVVTAATVALAA